MPNGINLGRQLLCIGGTNDKRVVNLVLSVNRVLLRKRRPWTELHKEPVGEPALTPADNEEYTVRRINFSDEKFVEVLGLLDWSDFEVFYQMTQPQ